MKISLNWLREYVDITMDVHQLTHRLTMVGLEVDAVQERFAYLDKVVVGHILEIAPHPNADRLRLCKVAAGEHVYEVVCGASNAAENMLVPLALPGTELPSGATVAEGVIRGVRSGGMLCSAAELGLGDDTGGLMALPDGTVAGQPLNQALALSDAVIEIGLTPNRPDCLSFLGIAREVAAIQGLAVQPPLPALPPVQDDIHTLTSVAIEAPEHCPRYAARLVTGITVGPSPFWLKERLSAVGLRPINNIVDVTNFVMLETGQPLHAFDFDRLAGRRIVVRTAADGELFTTLDGKERRLEPDMLMICDGEKPVAVGGVMGGLNSEIEDGTACVLIESAYFTPISIRRTAKRLGLKSDASHRFERGVDPRGTLYALDRAAQLITQLGGGKLIDGTIDVADDLPVAPTIELSVAATNRLLGTDVERDDIARLLSEIDFQVSTMNDDVLQVTVPSFRVDVSRPEDLMEEVARRIGYDQIPVTFPVIPAEAHPSAEAFLQRQEIRELLVGMGFAEAITYSFVPADAARRLGFGEQDPRSRQLAILNPLSEDQAVMRTSLVHGLLDTMHHNLAHQSRNLRLFEIGNIFISRGSDQQPEEIEMLAGLWTGDGNHAQWHTKARPCDFYDMKGTVEGLLKGLRVRDACITAQADEQCIYTAPGATALIMVDGEPLGIVGQMHPKVLAAYDLRQAAFVFELDVARLVARIPQRLKFRPLPKYPATTRDTTLIVARDLEADALVDFVRKADVPLVEEAHLFDVFEGGAMAPDQKSVSLRIVYRSVDTTLEDAAVNDLHKQLSERLVAHFKADLPA